MKSKNLLIITLLLLTLTCIVPHELNAQSPAKVSVVPSTTVITSAQVGSIVEVQIIVENVQTLIGWSLNLTWNPIVLNLTDIQEGSFLSDAGSTMFTWSPVLSPTSRSQGYINSTACILLEDTSVTGKGVLATIRFRVLNAGSSPISIEGTKLAKYSTLETVQYLAVTLNSGTVTINSVERASNNGSGGDSNNGSREDLNRSSDVHSDNNQNVSSGYSPIDTLSQQTLLPPIPDIVFLMVVVLIILLVSILIWHKKPLFIRN